MPRVPSRATQVAATQAKTDLKPSVRVASTANVSTSSPGAAIDGVTLASGDRVLLKDQSTAAQNGVYVFKGASTAMTRATDVDVAAEMTANTMVPIDEGTVSAGRMFRLVTTNVTVGTTSQSWAQAGVDLGSLTVANKLIEIGSGTSGTPSGDGGVIIERGSSTNAGIIWDESRDEFVLCTTSATGASTGDLTFTAANLSVDRIGAGTEQAQAKIHAKQDGSSGVLSSNAVVIIEDDARPAMQFTGNVNNIALIQFGDNAASESGQLYYDHSTDKLRVDAGGNTDRLTVDSSGDLVVAGVYKSAATLLELANGASTGADSGIVIERGSTGDNAAFLWDESRDEFVLCTTSATGASTGDLTFTPANLSVDRIGAGTEQAQAKIHAKQDGSSGVLSSNAVVIIEDDARPAMQFTGNANNIAMIQFGDNAASESGQLYYDHSTDKLRVDAGGNSDRLTIDANGDVVTAGDLTVSGGKVTLTNGSTVDSEGAGILLLTEDVVKTSAALRVGSNVIQASDGGSTITMDTSDNVTVAGALNVGVQSEGLTSAGAISPTLPVSIVTPSGAIAMTLADGSYVGQYKRIIDGASSGTDAITITPANMVSAKVSVTLNAPGEWVLFIWMSGSAPGGGWMFLDGYGAVQNDP